MAHQGGAKRIHSRRPHRPPLTPPDPVKTQMHILRRGQRRRINCHPHERQFLARLARARRADARAGRSPRLTLDALRTIAAARYA